MQAGQLSFLFNFLALGPPQVIPAMCAGKVMGPGGEAIKSLSERTGCSVVVEGKSPNAAFVPFRLVNYLAPGAAQIAAAVAEVVELVCQEEKYEAGEARGATGLGGCRRRCRTLRVCACAVRLRGDALAGGRRAGGCAWLLRHRMRAKPW